MTAPVLKVSASGKVQSPIFAQIRSRGLLNTMLEQPAQAYEAANPDMRCKWVHAPSNGDVTMITAHEALGFIVVQNTDVPGTASSKISGPVRCGDLVMMAAEIAIVEFMLNEDAQRAEDDFRLPETAFRDNLEARRVQRNDGVMDLARPIGAVRRTVETINAQPAEEGGED